MKLLLLIFQFVIRALKKIKRLFFGFVSKISAVCVCFYEMISSLFDKSIRICFTNFRDVSYHHFMIPATDILEQFNLSYKPVRYYKPDIHFFSVFGSKRAVIRSKSPCKIFFTGENPNTYRNGEYKGNCVENTSLSLGFDYMESENYFRLPLWLLYFFHPPYSKDKIQEVLLSFKNKYNKTKFCALVASHDRSGIRTKIYNAVSQIAPVDCPGNLLFNDKTLKMLYADNKAAYLQQYKFNICPENSGTPGYVTEKLFQSLYSGCIPIYNGGGYNRDPEPGILNPGILLWYDTNSGENQNRLFGEIKKLHSDDSLYRSFMDQPFFCDTAVDKIFFILQTYTAKIQSCISDCLDL